MEHRNAPRVVKIFALLTIAGLSVWIALYFNVNVRTISAVSKGRTYVKNHRDLSVNLPAALVQFNNSGIQPFAQSGSLSEKIQQLRILKYLKDRQDKILEESRTLRLQISTLFAAELKKTSVPVLSNSSHQDFLHRKRRVDLVCSTKDVPGRVGAVLTHSSGVIYCVVPKAGCTFWKRVLVVSNIQSNPTKQTVRAVSKEQVHFDMRDQLQGFNQSRHDTSSYPTRLLVSRDPFSRLLSSYLDKVYLPDFWQTEVVPIMSSAQPPASIWGSDLLRRHFDELAAIFSYNFIRGINTTAGEKTCGKFTTFAEFVALSLNRAEPHWMPIHQICNPCLFNATHLSTMETFTSDARVILQKMGLESMMQNLDEKSQVDEEIELISQYNFHHFYKNATFEFYQRCITPREIAYRLWHNFRWRGYIDPDIPYIIPAFRNLQLVEQDFMKQVWAARHSGLRNPLKMKRAKKEFFFKAFKTLSKTMFLNLYRKYDLDFQLFGYDDVKDALFSLYT